VLKLELFQSHFQAGSTNGTARTGGAGDNRQEPAAPVQAALPTNDVDLQANGHDDTVEVSIRLRLTSKRRRYMLFLIEVISDNQTNQRLFLNYKIELIFLI